jgi:hypothetical protein
MKSFKELILGLCVGGGVILILSGIGAVRAGNMRWPAYFMVGAIIVDPEKPHIEARLR